MEYIVKVGAWKRSPNLQKGSNASGFTVFVKSGTVGINTIYVCVNDIQDDTVGTDPLVFSSVKVSENPSGSDNFIQINSSGKFGSYPNFTFDGNVLKTPEIITSNHITSTNGSIFAPNGVIRSNILMSDTNISASGDIFCANMNTNIIECEMLSANSSFRVRNGNGNIDNGAFYINGPIFCNGKVECAFMSSNTTITGGTTIRGNNIVSDTSITIGTDADIGNSNSLIGLYGKPKVPQATTNIPKSIFIGNNIDDSTFDGYTIGQVVFALRQIGILL